MERLMLIDGWNILIACNATVHIEDHNTQPAGMFVGTLNVIRTLIDVFKPTKVIFVLDGPEAGERRRQIYPDYKGGSRVKERTSKVQIMNGEDNIVYGVEGAFQNQIIKVYEFLKFLPVTVVMIPYCEADDAITYLALKNKERFECIIVSNDKDYLQLIQPNVLVYRWKSKILYDEKKFSEEFRIKPQNYIFKKVMLGDTSDKVEGMKGIGEKTFKCLENNLNENIYTNLEEFNYMLGELEYEKLNTKEKNSFTKVLIEKHKMELAFQIMKLNEDCVTEEQIELLKMQIDEQQEKIVSRLSVKLKVRENPFNKLYNGFNDDRWLHPFLFLKTNIIVNC